MSGHVNSRGSSRRSTPITRSGASTVKRPEDYRLGDDINEFIPRRKVYLPNFPVSHGTLVDELETARSTRIDCLLKYLQTMQESMTARAKIAFALGKLKHDMVYASNFRPSAEKNPSSTDRSTTASPSPSGHADVRRSRLEGMDVAALPAGFGKRRSSAAGLSANKKTKTPPETAPEVEPGTGAHTPSPS